MSYASCEELPSVKETILDARTTDTMESADGLGLEDLSGHTVFFKDDSGQIFHTHSTYGRGDEEFLGAYRFLDVTPKGRDENGPYRTLGDWVRLRNMYGKGGIVEGNGRYHAPS